VKLTQSGADFCGSRFSNADIKLGDIKPKKPAPKQTQPTLTSLDQRGIFISALYWEYCLAPMQEMPKLELASAVPGPASEAPANRDGTERGTTA
jgi:hypothetical protein